MTRKGDKNIYNDVATLVNALEKEDGELYEAARMMIENLDTQIGLLEARHNKVKEKIVKLEMEVQHLKKVAQ